MTQELAYDELRALPHVSQVSTFKNVKWVAEINLVREPRVGYWEQYGYDGDAWVGRSNGYSS